MTNVKLTLMRLSAANVRVEASCVRIFFNRNGSNIMHGLLYVITWYLELLAVKSAMKAMLHLDDYIV